MSADASGDSTYQSDMTPRDTDRSDRGHEQPDDQQALDAALDSQLTSQAATDRSHQPDDEEESKQQESQQQYATHSTSTGMQSDDTTNDDGADGSDEVETANAGDQTGEPLESLEQELEHAHHQQSHQQLHDHDNAQQQPPQLPVEITILPDGFRHLELFHGDEDIATVKAILGERFKIPHDQMRLALGDLTLEDERVLNEYREFDLERLEQAGDLSDEARAQHTLSFVLHIESSDKDASQDTEPPKEAYKMPDIIKVVINREEIEAAELEAEEEGEEEKQETGDSKEGGASSSKIPEQVVYVQVVRDNLLHPKPFLGGFRHKYYGTHYHHASSQTARKKKNKSESVAKFHRETQTIQIVSRSQQTNREAGTQMERRDLLQDHSNDRVIMSKPYFTADELEALRDEKAKEIQCFLRQCFAWRRVRRLREAQAEKLDAEVRARAAKAKAEASEHARQIQRRMHPRTPQDFQVLFRELEAWRLHETQRIKESGLSAEEIAAALQELLNKEVKLLQTIDRLKITAAKENKWSRTQTALEKMASPKEWSSSEGDLIEVETPFTIRAKELVDLYNGACLRTLSRAQRVDVLLHIKYTVKEFDCELSREIVDLIKREEDLLRRQRSEASLEGCRKRLQNLFLQFVNTPAFNPEAANFQRVPQQPEDTVVGGMRVPPPALSSSLAKPAMLTRTNTVTVASNVAGRMHAAAAAKK